MPEFVVAAIGIGRECDQLDEEVFLEAVQRDGEYQEVVHDEMLQVQLHLKKHETGLMQR